MTLFKFNSGEVKDLDKPLANVLQTRGQGKIIEGEKEITPEDNKENKQVRKRKTK